VTEQPGKDTVEEKILTGFVVPQRLGPQEFLDKIRNARQSHVISNPMEPEILELYVLEGDEVGHYLSPDLIQISSADLQNFLTEFNDIMGGAGIFARRFKYGVTGDTPEA
jgi:hypothetical protein